MNENENKKDGSSSNMSEEKKKKNNNNHLIMNVVPWRAISSLIGGFFIQLTLGSFYSFGNMTTYMTAYMRYIINYLN